MGLKGIGQKLGVEQFQFVGQREGVGFVMEVVNGDILTDPVQIRRAAFCTV